MSPRDPILGYFDRSCKEESSHYLVDKIDTIAQAECYSPHQKNRHVLELVRNSSDWPQ